MTLTADSATSRNLGRAILGALAALLVVVLAVLLAGRTDADYLTVEREVEGTVTHLSADREAIALDVDGDEPLATRVLNPTEFNISPEDTVRGTLVKIPSQEGDSTEEALIVYAVE